MNSERCLAGILLFFLFVEVVKTEIAVRKMKPKLCLKGLETLKESWQKCPLNESEELFYVDRLIDPRNASLCVANPEKGLQPLHQNESTFQIYGNWHFFVIKYTAPIKNILMRARARGYMRGWIFSQNFTKKKLSSMSELTAEHCFFSSSFYNIIFYV